MLKNFWERRLMWVWCFDSWFELMKDPNPCNKHWFWLLLNNFNQMYGLNDQFEDET